MLASGLSCRGHHERVRRDWHVIALGCWALACFAFFARHGGVAWHFFTSGSALLFSGASTGGLHLYASHPQLQIGPAAFVVAEGLRQIGPHHGVLAAEAVLMALGLWLLREVIRIALITGPGAARRPGVPRVAVLAGGAAFLAGWAELAATFTHLDDAVALLLAVLAVRCAIAQRPVLAGLCVALAVGFKPWALAFLPLAFLPPARAWWRAAASAGAVIAAAWLPFALADHGTVAALHYTIRNMPGSALRALGVLDPRTPSWDRPAQLALGCALGAVALRRGRWAAVILLGVGARIALDPADHGYYTAGVLAGALLWDLAGPRRAVPLWTLAALATLTLAHAVTKDSALLGQLRLGLVLAFTAAILLGPPWRSRAPSATHRRWCPGVPVRRVDPVDVQQLDVAGSGGACRPRSGLAPDSAEGVDARRGEGAGVGTPLRYWHQAGVDEREPGEEGLDLLRAAELVGHRSGLGVPLSGLPVGRPGADAVGQDQAAARGQAAEQAADDAVGLVVVADVPHDPDEE
jgi:hypothetical protein